MQRFLQKLPFYSRQLFVVLSVVQVLCATYFLRLQQFQAINSLLFLFCGVTSAICILYFPPIAFNKASIINNQSPIKLLIVAACLPVSYHLVRDILDATPVQIQYADMLPIMGVMCQRFLHGQFTEVYNPIPEIWNGIQPIYLPALWLPFCSAFVFDFDMRWVTVAGIWLSILICILPAWRKTIMLLLFVPALVVLLAWLHLDKVNNVIRLTEEGIVFFYYSLLAMAIISKNAWFIGSVAALCLLSRYAIVGWLPFAIILMLHTKEYKFLIKMLSAGIIVTCLLIIPFGINSFLFQWKLPQQYILHAERVWAENSEFFYHSLGVAKFFGKSNVHLLHTILVWGSFIVPIIFFSFVRKKNFTTVNVLLAGLQLSLCFFYNFLDVSYLYLFYTPVFVSLVIAGWYLSANKKTFDYK